MRNDTDVHSQSALDLLAARPTGSGMKTLSISILEASAAFYLKTTTTTNVQSYSSVKKSTGSTCQNAMPSSALRNLITKYQKIKLGRTAKISIGADSVDKSRFSKLKDWTRGKNGLIILILSISEWDRGLETGFRRLAI